MDDQDLVSVCTVQSPTEAEIIRSAFQAEGIACQIGGESQAGLAGVLSIDVLVHSSDAGKARKLLKRVRRGKVERKKKRVAAKRAKAQSSDAIQELKPDQIKKKKPS